MHQIEDPPSENLINFGLVFLWQRSRLVEAHISDRERSAKVQVMADRVSKMSTERLATSYLKEFPADSFFRA